MKDRRDGEVAVEKAINALINYGILEEYQDETSGTWLLIQQFTRICINGTQAIWPIVNYFATPSIASTNKHRKGEPEMNKTFRYRLLLIVALGLTILFTGCAKMFLAKGFPQVDGEIRGLPVQSQVEVYRDAMGIPHLYAQNEHDLFFAQGYVHAQDRLWQMETTRRLAAGRLAEVAGEKVVDLDHWSRILALPQLRKALAKEMSKQEQEILDAYIAGVNAFIDQHRNDLPLEFQSLKLVPEPWTPEDVFSGVALNAIFLSTNFPGELAALAERDKVAQKEWKLLFPSYPNANLPNDIYFEKISKLKIGPYLPAALSYYPGVSGEPGAGSNNWVVAHSSDGKPLLSNDPHLSLTVPGIWYFNHLNAPGYHVTGGSMAGIPGILIGHNDRVAWAVTNVMIDNVDLYVLRLDPANRDYYFVGDRRLEMRKDQQVYRLPKGQQITRTIYQTIYGPVITQITPDTDAVAVFRWYGTIPSELVQDKSMHGFLQLSRARSVKDTFEAGRFLKIVGQNIVAADVDGNIGWHATGAVPLRKGYSGRLPADGSSGQVDWTGFLPYDQMPSKYNPEEGFIATANNRSVGTNTQVELSYSFCSPYRYQRISDKLAQLKNPTPDDFRELQLDVYSLEAEGIILKLRTYQFSNPQAQRAMSLLAAWDRQVSTDSVGATVYAVFLKQWARALLEDEFTENGLRFYLLNYGAQMMAHDVIMDHPESTLWDNVNTPEKETPQQILEQALVNTWQWLEQEMGKNPEEWKWGRLHQYVWAYPGAESATQRKLLNRGPFPAPGNNTTVNVSFSRMYQNHFKVTLIPSLRMIVPLGDLTKATIVAPMGQSGQPGHPHYDDMIEPWLKAEGAPMYFTEEAVTRNAKSKLVLAPK